MDFMVRFIYWSRDGTVYLKLFKVPNVGSIPALTFAREEITVCGYYLWGKFSLGSMVYCKSRRAINLEKVMKSDREKIEKYESLLHQIQMYYSVVLDSSKVKKLLDNIAAWSYAHRSGNGELTEEEQQSRIDEAFDALEEI